ncbi:hypothetical protein CBR_g6503 [Chara braunii]|uniref:Uncharacterized protein n=1 Tax=Chara braunii TaxID=69332 RepID=A0A388KJY6_CHABU|nr:hypothetical protein CBR_g6503 [Chara braunii]|eukprot:GBG70375.1 hypothetical protein CBR_g6503 [Chara braunii]
MDDHPMYGLLVGFSLWKALWRLLFPLGFWHTFSCRVDTRGGASTKPYTKEEEEKMAAILQERKEKKEAKKKALKEEQAAKLKKIEEEMAKEKERIQKEEERKLKEVEEEEEDETPLQRKKEQYSGSRDEEMEKQISKSDFTKTAMPRGGKGTRPPQRPLGASGGYERHGPRHRESTLEYDGGDIELFLDNFWEHARRMGWTVTQGIERLRGVGRFEGGLRRSLAHTQEEPPAFEGPLRELESHLDISQWRASPRGEEHGEQEEEVPREEVPREEVPREEVQDTWRERGLGDEGRREGKEVIEVGEGTPPQTPAMGLRLGDAPGSTYQAGERLQREETFIRKGPFARRESRKEERKGSSEPRQGPPMGRVFLEPEEARAQRQAERKAFEFRAPTEVATLPVAAAGPVVPLPVEEGRPPSSSEPAQGSAGGFMSVLLEAVHTMQEEVSLFSPEQSIEEPLEREMEIEAEGAIEGGLQRLGTPEYGPEEIEEQPMAVPGKTLERRPQRLDTPEYVPATGDLRSRLGSWATGSGFGGPTPGMEKQEVVSTTTPRSEQEGMVSTLVESPSSPPPQSRKKKFKRKVDQLCFYYKRGMHLALDCLEFLEDKA